MALTLHTPAPDFTTLTDGGRKITLHKYKGKYIVLYFYPKDNTETCTKQACAFRDNMKRITKLGAVVIGISPDTVKKHDKFKSDYGLNFILACDEDKSICEAYGVWAEKSMYGRKYMGVLRTTYIIDPTGTISHVFENVKVAGHVDAVIASLGTP
ncbi:MAG: thioredoxin-dependent thiol peroxidase [Ignavibacteria bacterium]|nr:thioredoxin-dependent thiol peroxidase [Ignavibacteria bacterium]